MADDEHRITALQQPVASPLTAAAIFLIVAVRPGAESRAAVQSEGPRTVPHRATDHRDGTRTV